MRSLQWMLNVHENLNELRENLQPEDKYLTIECNWKDEYSLQPPEIKKVIVHDSWQEMSDFAMSDKFKSHLHFQMTFNHKTGKFKSE